jgi:LysR family hydrogen peroxide-inducible transcriptional activator
MRSEAIDDPGIVIRPIKASIAERDIALIWRPTSPLSAKFQTVGNVLAEAAKDLLKDELL